MRGILSGAPGPSAIRLMVGTHLLLLIQAALVLWSAPNIDAVLRALVALVFVLAVSGFCIALHGLSDDNRQTWWRRRNGH